MNPESPAPSRSWLWGWGAVGLLMLYLLGSGVTHGLYYNQHLSDETWSVVEQVYAPVDWLEGRLGEDNVIFNVKYWWYIKIQYGWSKKVDWSK